MGSQPSYTLSLLCHLLSVRRTPSSLYIMSGIAGSTETSTTVSSSISSLAPTIYINPFATIGIKSHIPINLEMKKPNFNKWVAFFQKMVGKFVLMHHIDGTAKNTNDPQWVQEDCCVRSWLYGSVCDDVLALSMEPNQHARALYVAIDNLC